MSLTFLLKLTPNRVTVIFTILRAVVSPVVTGKDAEEVPTGTIAYSQERE